MKIENKLDILGKESIIASQEIKSLGKKEKNELLNAIIETLKNDKDLLRRLHVKEGDKIIEGAEAFLFVWKKIPKYKLLYKFFKLPIIFTLFKYGYEIIAFFLYLKNKHQLKN